MSFQNRLDPPAIIKYETHSPMRFIWESSSVQDNEAVLVGFLERAVFMARSALSELKKKYPILLSSDG